MKVVTFHGLRGGVGTTSSVAMLADALHRQGQAVLMIDLNPSDMLRLLFNIPYITAQGLAAALTHRAAWQEQAFEISPGLSLLPYGRHGLASGPIAQQALAELDTFCVRMLDQLSPEMDWVIFDLPAGETLYKELRTRAGLDVAVVSVDMGCHVLIRQAGIALPTHILAVQHEPARLLSNDVLHGWKHRYEGQLIPVAIHRDESVHESMALKAPVTQAFPDCVASGDAFSLATWLQAWFGQMP